MLDNDYFVTHEGENLSFGEGDDADMLLDIARVTGLGRLFRVPARRTSRPQVCWAVQSKLECRRLVEFLERYPLRGRKQREFRVWAAAVDEWADSLYGAGHGATHRTLRARASELRDLRRYVDRAECCPAGERQVDGLTAFLGGLFTGEGSFGLDGRAVACIHLRADERTSWRTFGQCFDLGRVTVSTPTGLNPSAKWTVGRRAELPRAIAVLDAAVLRGRKRREFEAWRVGAAEYARDRDRDEAVIEAARAALHKARSYVECDVVLPSQVPAATVYVAVLRAFAAEAPEVMLTATEYERARRRYPEWPTRNTVATAFGGWARALEAAGLESRVTARARSRARRA
jgi:hypothetical protein